MAERARSAERRYRGHPGSLSSGVLSHPAPPPPGWYPDPGNSALVRWWDGGRWTEHAQPVPPVGSSLYQVGLVGLARRGGLTEGRSFR